ncbi:MAG TPA: hypothetical protein VFC70_01615, partial [Oscillospiraceae bacterium]|nr:hypothetical protein [Oscillospiraceae bacterium]
LIIGVILITSCNNGKLPVNGDNSSEKNSDSSMENKIENVIVRGDEDGLVKIRTENGKVYISFDVDKWINDPDFYDYLETQKEVHGYDGNIIDEEFIIGELSGTVKDICVGKIESLEYVYDSDFITPAVFFLMEDGTVEWMYAFPYITEFQDETVYMNSYVSYGKISWIKDIVSLSYEAETEGVGNKSVFATDKEGLKYNLKIPAGLGGITSFPWTTELFYDEHHDTYYVVDLRLSEDGKAVLTKGLSDYPPEKTYEGTYELYLDESSSKGYRAGMIGFDLKSRSPDFGEKNREFKGVYFIDSDFNSMTLWPADGDIFHQGIDEYKFFSKLDGEMIDIWGMTDEKLTEYLLMCVPEAEHYVKDLGMAVLVTDEATKFEYGEMGRNIWLGTDHKDHFVKEILYTVTNYNQVFEYDVVNDEWNLSW